MRAHHLASTHNRGAAYSGVRANVDVNEDSSPSMRKAQLWCPNAICIFRRQRGFAPFDAQNTTLVPERKIQTSTSARIRTFRCTEHHSGAQSQPLFFDLHEDPQLSMRKATLWCAIARSKRRRQRGSAPFDAQNTTLVRDRTFQASTSTRIRTLRCTKHHSGDRSHIPSVDVNEDRHHSMHRTPPWCAIAHSKRRRQRGFAPFYSQNTTLVPNRTVHRM